MNSKKNAVEKIMVKYRIPTLEEVRAEIKRREDLKQSEVAELKRMENEINKQGDLK
jgi:hypothetical protein